MNWKQATSRTHFSPQAVGTIHFVGIGGIGMSGIAEILHHLGYKVQGSDLSDNANVKRLRDKGVRIFIGHKAENVAGANVLVVTSAVKSDNVELIAAREAFLPIVRRAEMLGELMRFKWTVAVGGTHGKTTTTSMIAQMLDTADLDPTVVNGGIINSYGTNARLGSGEWMVVEADESDGSFLRLPATVAVVTNMDAEHMDHYKNFEDVRHAYETFVQNIPFYGFAVLCADHPEVKGVIDRVCDRKVISYGFCEDADVRAVNLQPQQDGTRFDVVYREKRPAKAPQQSPRTITGFFLPVMGSHNVQNSLAAIAVGLQLGLPEVMLKATFAKFESVKRRFTRTGCVNGITIVDDYGHHPIEIQATLKAALQAKGNEGRVIAVVQPHRYTRLKNLFNDFCNTFNDADAVIVSDVYPAGETPIEGANRDALVQGLCAQGHKDVYALDNPNDLAGMVAEIAKPGDYVICLGAGSSSAWAYALPGELEALLLKGKAARA